MERENITQKKGNVREKQGVGFERAILVDDFFFFLQKLELREEKEESIRICDAVASTSN